MHQQTSQEMERKCESIGFDDFYIQKFQIYNDTYNIHTHIISKFDTVGVTWFNHQIAFYEFLIILKMNETTIGRWWIEQSVENKIKIICELVLCSYATSNGEVYKQQMSIWRKITQTSISTCSIYFQKQGNFQKNCETSKIHTFLLVWLVFGIKKLLHTSVYTP